MHTLDREEPGFNDWTQGDFSWPYGREGGRNFSQDLPSIGSAQHAFGNCRPCLWFHKSTGCRNARDCSHCHLCPADRKNSDRRRKGKGKGETEGRGEKSDKGEKGRTDREEGWEEPTVPEPPGPPVPEPPGGASRPRWSKGSERHGLQRCRPCLLLWTSGGCKEGEECYFCHICIPEQFQKLPPPPPPGGPPPQHERVAPPPPSSQPAPAGAAGMAIQLAERLPPEPQPASTAPVVLGTAPPYNPSASAAGTPVPRSTGPRRKSTAQSTGLATSNMPMGVLEGPPCHDCGGTLHCICFPGGQGFSAVPIRGPEALWPDAPPAEPTKETRGPSEANGSTGRRSGAGYPKAEDSAAERDVSWKEQQTFQDLMQNGGQELGDPPEVRRRHAPGECTPCLEYIQTKVCSAGESCQFCHQCAADQRRRTKKIGNLALPKSKKMGNSQWL